MVEVVVEVVVVVVVVMCDRDNNDDAACHLTCMMTNCIVTTCREFSNVIEQRNAKDASESDRVRGQQRAEQLQVT